MKPLKEQSDGDYYSVEFAEPQMDDVDMELLDRFLQMLEGEPTPADSYDDLSTQLDDVSQTQNSSSG